MGSKKRCLSQTCNAAENRNIRPYHREERMVSRNIARGLNRRQHIPRVVGLLRRWQADIGRRREAGDRHGQVIALFLVRAVSTLERSSKERKRERNRTYSDI
jgi:hypothetical protein